MGPGLRPRPFRPPPISQVSVPTPSRLSRPRRSFTPTLPVISIPHSLVSKQSSPSSVALLLQLDPHLFQHWAAQIRHRPLPLFPRDLRLTLPPPPRRPGVTLTPFGSSNSRPSSRQAPRGRPPPTARATRTVVANPPTPPTGPIPSPSPKVVTVATTTGTFQSRLEEK